MTTLRRKAIQTTMDIMHESFDYVNFQIPLANIPDVAGKIVDAILELRGFQGSSAGTPEQQAFHERREELKDILAENSLEAAIILGKPLAKSAQKVKDSVEFHGMICAQLARLPFNFEGDREQEQEDFRRFVKAKRKLGQELETWVNWWMSDEWRVANPPWKLTTVKVKWLEAFQQKRSSGRRMERLSE